MRVFVLLLLVAVPFASAQDAVYATSASVTGGTGNIVYEASQEAPSDGAAYAAFGQGGLSYSTEFSGTLGQDYLPGQWELRLQLSCDRPTGYRPTTTTDVYRPTVTSTLTVGGTTFDPAHGESTLRTCDGPDDVWELVWPIDGSAAEPAAGAAVSWVTNVWWVNPPPGAAQNGYFVIGAEGTGLFGLMPASTAPAPEGPPVTVNASLDEPYSQVFGQPFNGTYVFTHNATGAHELNITVGGHNGTATLRVADPAGSEIYNHTAKAWNETIVLEGLTPDWNITLHLAGFEGAVGLQLAAPHASPTGSGPQPTDDSTAANGTSDAGPTGSGEDAEDTPALGLLPVLALLYVATRRRH